MHLIQAAENKYNQLLTVLCILFFVSPLHQFSLVIAVFLFLTITIVVRTLGLKPRMILLYEGVAVFLLLSQFVPQLGILGEDVSLSLRIVGVAAHTFYFGLPVLYISRDLFYDKRVNADTIKGGICVYILIGFLWAFLYMLITFFDANAFTQDVDFLGDFIYFSFTTLTTLGYGDISPLDTLAKNLANLEAIIGQMYPAIFIARLVSLYDQQPAGREP